MELKLLIDEFVEACQAEGVAPRTIGWYQDLLARYQGYVNGNPWWETRTVRGFMAVLQSQTEKYTDHPTRPVVSCGLSPYTVNAYYRALRRFFNWLVLEEHLDVSPLVRVAPPKLPKRRFPRAISRQDLERILAAATAPRDYALVRFLIDTGCRVSEMCGLQMEDLELEDRKARVHGKGKRDRYLVFEECTKEALTAWLAVRPTNQGTAVFLGTRGPLTPLGVHKLLQRLGELGGATGRVNPHSFRHAFAREYLQNGGDLATLSQLLGHDSIKTTAEFYTIFLTNHLQEKHSRHAPMAWLDEVN